MTTEERIEIVMLICASCGKSFDMPVKLAYIQTHRDKTLRPIRWCWECVQKMWKGGSTDGMPGVRTEAI